MKAMIFAAGFGSRLGDITRNRPKALVDIGGTTPLELAVTRLSKAGFKDLVVNVHHHAEQVAGVAKELCRGGVSVTVSDESGMLLDTGGGLYKARNFFDNEPFMLYNVDIVNSIDLDELYRFHKKRGGLATLAVRQREGNRFLLVDSAGILQGWTNRVSGKTILTDDGKAGFSEVAFSGIHVVDPEIFGYMTEGIYTMISLYLSLVSSHQINTFPDNSGFWMDIGTPEKLEECRKLLTKGDNI